MLNSAKYIYQHKNGTWYYRRRIPAHIRDLISATRIKRSLKTTDVNLAAARSYQINEVIELEWIRIANEGINEDKEIAYQIAVRRAQTLNLRYLTNQQLLNEDCFEEVIKRITFLEENNFNPESLTADAVLGLVDFPEHSHKKT